MARKHKLTLALAQDVLQKSGGMITKAAILANCNRQTFYNFMEQHPELYDLRQEIEDTYLDQAESKLQDLIQEGNVAAVIFYLKTKGKKRGYTEKSEMDISSNGQNINTIQLVEVINNNGSVNEQ